MRSARFGTGPSNVAVVDTKSSPLESGPSSSGALANSGGSLSSEDAVGSRDAIASAGSSAPAHRRRIQRLQRFLRFVLSEECSPRTSAASDIFGSVSPVGAPAAPRALEVAE